MTSPALVRVRDAAWLADVRLPGPNGPLPDQESAAVLGNIMLDSVDVSQFVPGAAAYAGYSDGRYANMTAVRAYAAAQGARSFSFTVTGRTAANAIDIEPGDATPADAPVFYRTGGRYLYGGASWVPQITSALAPVAARSQYKIISAHYTGSPHICAPSSCGYAQADATQFSDNYLGRNIDATQFSSTFWELLPPVAPWPLQQGSTGPNVVVLQNRLNRWKLAVPPLSADGSFGALTKTAVQKALARWHYSAAKVAAGVVDEALWNYLATAPSAPPPAPSPVPKPPPPPAPRPARTVTGVTVTLSDGTKAVFP